MTAGCARPFCQKQEPRLLRLDFTRATIFYKPDFVFENETDLSKRQSQELSKTYAEKLTLLKITLPEKMNLAKKPEPNLPKLLLKILKPISET